MGAHRRDVARIPAALVALFWTIAPALSVIHGLESRHRYCFEHGAFEESDESGADSGEPRGQDSRITRTSSREDAAHAECPFSHFFRSNASLTGHRTCVIVAPAVDEGAIALRSVDVRPIELLARAPKNSPPARV